MDSLDSLDGLDALDALDCLDALDNLDASFTPPPANSLQSVVPTGSLEQDVEDEANALLEGFKARARAEDDRFFLATDSEYWTCICFQSREQAEAFARASKWYDPNDKYVDGVMLAKRLGIELPPANVPYNTSQKTDWKLNELVEDE